MKTVLLVFTALITLASCGHRQFTKGEYDDVNEVRLLDDKFNESDAKLLADEMIKSLSQHPSITSAHYPPVVQVEHIRNKTSEHIDTKMITDSVRTALLKTGKIRFSNKEDRSVRDAEIDYQNDSGRIREDTVKRKDGGIGADFLITGDLVSNIQEVGSRKLIFYKLTLNMTNLENGLIVWSEDKEIRKRYTKKRVGM